MFFSLMQTTVSPVLVSQGLHVTYACDLSSCGLNATVIQSKLSTLPTNWLGSVSGFQTWLQQAIAAYSPSVCSVSLALSGFQGASLVQSVPLGPASPSPKSQAGAIVGIVLGVLALVAVASGLMIVFRRRRDARSTLTKHALFEIPRVGAQDTVVHSNPLTQSHEHPAVTEQPHV